MLTLTKVWLPYGQIICKWNKFIPPNDLFCVLISHTCIKTKKIAMLFGCIHENKFYLVWHFRSRVKT